MCLHGGADPISLEFQKSWILELCTVTTLARFFNPGLGF